MVGGLEVSKKYEYELTLRRGLGYPRAHRIAERSTHQPFITGQQLRNMDISNPYLLQLDRNYRSGMVIGPDSENFILKSTFDSDRIYRFPKSV